MTTIAQVRSQLASIVAGVTGVASASSYLKDAIKDLPGAYVARPGYDPRLVFSERKQAYQFQVWVYGQRTDEVRAQQSLDLLAEPSGATSIVEAVQTESKWGSVTVDYAVVTNVGPVQETSLAGVAYFVEVFDIEICW